EGQDRKRPRLVRQLQANVDPLPHGYRESTALQRLDVLAVHRDQGPFELAEIKREGGGGGAVDDPETDAAAAFHRDDFWIVEGAVIGEIGFVVDVVQIRCHATHPGYAAGPIPLRHIHAAIHVHSAARVHLQAGVHAD